MGRHNIRSGLGQTFPNELSSQEIGLHIRNQDDTRSEVMKD